MGFNNVLLKSNLTNLWTQVGRSLPYFGISVSNISQEGGNWELGFVFLLTGKIGLDFLGLGFGKREKIGIGVNIGNFSIFLLGIFDYSSTENRNQYLPFRTLMWFYIMQFSYIPFTLLLRSSSLFLHRLIIIKSTIKIVLRGPFPHEYCKTLNRKGTKFWLCKVGLKSSSGLLILSTHEKGKRIAQATHQNYNCRQDLRYNFWIVFNRPSLSNSMLEDSISPVQLAQDYF